MHNASVVDIWPVTRRVGRKPKTEYDRYFDGQIWCLSYATAREAAAARRALRAAATRRQRTIRIGRDPVDDARLYVQAVCQP